MMISNDYTKISFNKPKTESRKLKDYLVQNITKTIKIGDKSFTLKNISMDNNIFLNYCYNKSAFGKRRVFKTHIQKRYLSFRIYQKTTL